jgi:hypothetical protein
MSIRRGSLVLAVAFVAIASCSATKYLRGGIHRELDENLTIVKLTENPGSYLGKTVVLSVRYDKLGNLPCPLGPDFVNFVIADRVSKIALNKVWVRKEKASVLDSFKPMDTIVMKAKIFQVDREKDPNLEALEIVPE